MDNGLQAALFCHENPNSGFRKTPVFRRRSLVPHNIKYCVSTAVFDAE